MAKSREEDTAHGKSSDSPGGRNPDNTDLCTHGRTPWGQAHVRRNIQTPPCQDRTETWATRKDHKGHSLGSGRNSPNIKVTETHPNKLKTNPKKSEDS